MNRGTWWSAAVNRNVDGLGTSSLQWESNLESKHYIWKLSPLHIAYNYSCFWWLQFKWQFMLFGALRFMPCLTFQQLSGGYFIDGNIPIDVLYAH